MAYSVVLKTSQNPELSHIMPLTPEVTQAMRQIIAELLQIDEERLVPEANFFRDLEGTFDDLKPMRLRTEAAFGVKISAITDEVNARTSLSNGLVTKKSLKAIGDYLGLKLGGKPIPFLDLFSVAFIEAITARAIEQRDSDKGEQGSAGRFPSYSRAPEVRKIVGRVLNVPADQLSAQTDLSGIDGLILAIIISELNAHWGISVDKGVDEIISATHTNSKGTLTRQSRQKLAQLLPGVDFDSSKEGSAAVLDRLGILEAIVERDATEEKPKTPLQPIFHLPAGFAWTEQQSQPLLELQQSLGDRKAQGVLAESCRIANVDRTHWSSLAAQCIEALTYFSKTGKGKKDLRELARDLKGWEREGIPLLRALTAGLRADVPRDLLVWAAKVLSVAENLEQQHAVDRVHSIAKAHAADESSPEDELASRKKGKKSLLSRLPKRAQRELPEVLERCGNRTLKEYIAWEWKFEQQMDSARQKHFWARLEKNRGLLSLEQCVTGSRFSHVYSSLPDLAVARRFCLEDATEVLIGLSLAGRIGWMEQGSKGRSFDDPLLGALAVRDAAVAERYLETLPVWNPDSDTDFDLRSDGVLAVLRRDFGLLKTALDRDVHRFDIAWYKAMIDFFQGIMEDDPKKTSAALQRFFEAMKRVREKILTQFAFCSMTHGFYRLAESISPRLVSEFDVSQDFPWDAEVHERVNRNERPWEEFDLSDVSEELHTAITTLHRPIWWI